MSGVNRAIILGRLGKDPETRTLEKGNMVCNFSVATSEVYKDKNTGEKKETTDWHNIVFWGAQAEVAAKYLHKGDQVYIEGKIRTRSWEKDGITRYTTEIIGSSLSLLGGNKQESQAVPAQQRQITQTQQKKEEETALDSLPF